MLLFISPFIIANAKHTICHQCINLGSRNIRLPEWAQYKGNNPSLPDSPKDDCLFSVSPKIWARTYLDQQWTHHEGRGLDDKRTVHADYVTGQGYVKNMNYFLDQVSYVPSNPEFLDDKFKDIYEKLLEECIQRCFMVKDQGCAYANGFARKLWDGTNNTVKNSSLDMPDEVLAYRDNLTRHSKDRWDGSQKYFQCSLLNNNGRGLGIPAIKDVNSWDSFLVHDGAGAKWCGDGTVYASHVADIYPAHGKPNDTQNQREKFCSQNGGILCIALSLNKRMTGTIPGLRMSTPVAWNITDHKMAGMVEVYQTTAANFDEMNSICMNDRSCVGYNFVALPLSSIDHVVGKHYTMHVFGYLSDDDAAFEEAMKFYKNNIEWSRESNNSDVFEPQYTDNGSRGMAIKLAPCSEYDDLVNWNEDPRRV